MEGKTDKVGRKSQVRWAGDRQREEDDKNVRSARGAEGTWSLESLWVNVTGTLPERIEREAPLTDKSAGSWMRKRLHGNYKE